MRHIIGFYSHAKPKIVLREEGAVNELELKGRLEFELSFNRYCVGYSRMGNDYPCPDGAVSNAMKCPRCRGLELSCASCRGEECVLGLGGECVLGAHYVYIAAFGELLKAGVTKKERLRERLVEQGADFGVPVAEAEDGMEARTLEALLQHQFRFKNSVRTSEKFRSLGADQGKSKQALERAVAEIEGFPGVEAGGIINLTGVYPRIPGKPIVGSELKGEVLGAKGKLLFLERNGIVALDMGRLLGRYITKER